MSYSRLTDYKLSSRKLRRRIKPEFAFVEANVWGADFRTHKEAIMFDLKAIMRGL